MNRLQITACATLSAALLTACGGKPPASDPVKPAAEAVLADVTTERLINAAATPAEWLTHGGTYDEQRHSGLTGIDKTNVASLGVAWTYDLATSRGVESTPIVVDGVMYVTSAWSVVYALDAKTGAELWVYDPGSIARSASMPAAMSSIAVSRSIRARFMSG